MKPELPQRTTIAVLVKHAADPTTVVADPTTGRIDRSQVVWRPDGGGLAALSWALAARETSGWPGWEARVLALVCGGPDADTTAQHALALGADEAIRVSLDWGGPGSATVHDPVRTARALAAATEGREVVLALAGAASTDRGSGLVPPAYAETLRLRYAGDAILEEPKLAIGDGQITFARLSNRGQRVELAVRLPAVIGLRASPVPVPHASFEQRRASLRARVPVVTVAAAFVPPQRSVRPARVSARLRPIPSGNSAEERVRSMMSAGGRTTGRIVAGPVQSLVDAAIEFLEQQGILGEEATITDDARD